MPTAISELDEHVAPTLRPNGWRPDEAVEEAAKERSTCGGCLARTYRHEECVCDPDKGDAEDYDEAYADGLAAQRITHAAATFYDPHGNHVETVDGTLNKVVTEAAGYLYRMVREGYPVTVIIEPETLEV